MPRHKLSPEWLKTQVTDHICSKWVSGFTDQILIE